MIIVDSATLGVGVEHRIGLWRHSRLMSSTVIFFYEMFLVHLDNFLWNIFWLLS